MQKAGTQWCCRTAPSLGGGFAGTPESAWGTKPYNPETDIEKPCVFFGLYGLADFYALWRHKGRKAILWCGSDIRYFREGYWLDDEGKITLGLSILALVQWINKNCESWVENEIECKALKKIGIESKICPSFLGNLDDYEVSFKSGNKVYTSVSGNDFKLYGWDKIPKLARNNLDIELHLYGCTNIYKLNQFWGFPIIPNIFHHGRISKKQMNSEIKEMQGALRLTQFDGFSEILAESILWGQWPVSPYINYPYILKDLRKLMYKTKPNIEGREYYRKILNNYPWNQKKQIENYKPTR